MATMVFLHKASEPYTGQTLRERPLRGVQSGTILLAEELRRRGHDVAVFNDLATPQTYDGVDYRPFAEAAEAEADLIVVNNNIREFDDGPRLRRHGRRVVWLRNPTSFSRLYKKKNLGPLLRHRPDAVFLSKSHKNAVSPLIPFRERHIIELGVDAVFHGREPENAARPPRAVFYSEFYRGVDWVLDVWRHYVHPIAPKAELHIFGDLKGRPSDDFAAHNIVHHEKAAKPELAAFLGGARVLLFQGHRDEAGCNTAIESYASGLAIVTLGIGVLGERVDHGETGFIAKDAEGFGRAAARVLTEDDVWLRMHRNALQHWSVRPWSFRAEQWERAFLG